MKKIIFFLISAFIGLSLFVAVIWRVGLRHILHTINEFSISKWFIVFLFSVIQFCFTTYRWKIILKSQGYNVGITKLFISKLVGFSVDYTSPTPNVGGEAIRAYVLKKDTGTPFSQGLASVIIDKLLDFSYALPFTIFAIFYVLLKFNLSLKIIIGLLLVGGGFIFLMFLFYYRTLKKKVFFSSIIRFLQLHRLSFVAKAMDKIGQFEQIIIDFFHQDKKTFYHGLIISFVAGIFAFSGAWLILFFLGLKANILDVLIVGTLTTITFILPTPGSVGGTEVGEALIFRMIGFQPEYGIAYVLIFRSIDILKVIIGFLFLSHFGLNVGKTIIEGEAFKLSSNNGNKPTQGLV